MDSDTPELKRVWDAMADVGVAMLVAGTPGALLARPMAPILRPAEGLIWFLSDGAGGLDDALASSPSVLLTFSDGERTHVSVAGTVSLHRDRETIRALWSREAEAWLPAGPDGPGIVAIRVVPQAAELWQGWNRLIELARTAAALVSGKRPPTAGDHVRVGAGTGGSAA